MAGISDMQFAMGYEQIKVVLGQHVPPIQWWLLYDEPHSAWTGHVSSEDGIEGRELGATKAEALKKAYMIWLEKRLDMLNAADSAPSTPPTEEAPKGGDSSASKGLDASAETVVESAEVPSPTAPQRTGKSAKLTRKRTR